MSNKAVIVFRKKRLKYSFVVELGIIIDIGCSTPKWMKGKSLKEVGRILIKRKFIVSNIIN